MGNYDNNNAGVDTADLYSGVKLRASKKKVGAVANDVFAAEDGKTASTRSRKYSCGIRLGVFSDNVAAQLETLNRKIAIAGETNPYYYTSNKNYRMNQQFPDVQDFDISDLLSDGTAIEMLDALREESPKSSSNKRFDIGDLVWGRVKSYPWWPGQIFDEVKASPSVKSDKKEGCILVSFYGDYTYAWLSPKQIVPFDINFYDNLKQTNARAFLMGVKEAMAEIKRRVALGLACHCQKDSNLQPMMMEGNSIKLIQKAREDFHPQEIIFFLKHLALSPRKNVKKNLYWIKTVANISAYRKAVVKEFDETCAQDFKEQHKSLEWPAGITKENQHGSQGAASRNFCCSSKGLEEQFRPKDLANPGNKRKVLGHLKELDMEIPVRMKKLKYLASFAANSKVLKLQGESQTGKRSCLSTEPQKTSQIKQESFQKDVKERQLTIKFPPQTILPSFSEVKSKFTCFGPLDEYSTNFLWKSSTYQLAFQHKSDAEAAYRHAIQSSSLFSISGVKYFLQASDPDLNASDNTSGLAENQKQIHLAASLKTKELVSQYLHHSSNHLGEQN